MRAVVPKLADDLGTSFNDDTLLVRKAASFDFVDDQGVDESTNTGIIVGRITSLSVDTYNEVILPEGLDDTRYAKNNVVLRDHSYTGYLPHGESAWRKIYPSKKPTEVRAATKYYLDDDWGRKVYEHRSKGRPLGYSIGFIPVKYIFQDDDDWDDVLEKWMDRYAAYRGNGVKKKDIPIPDLIYLKWILLEYSDVVVPANPDTVQMWVQRGLIESSEADRYTINEGLSRFAPDEYIAKDIVLRPYPNEHACRLKDPDQYDKFARKNCHIKSDDKCIDVIFGIKGDTSEIQAYRYPSDVWSEGDAKEHCTEHEGTFEAASEGKDMDGHEMILRAICEQQGIKLPESYHPTREEANIFMKVLGDKEDDPDEDDDSVEKLQAAIIGAFEKSLYGDIEIREGGITTALSEFSIKDLLAKKQGRLE
jgi:hypothetical protein